MPHKHNDLLLLSRTGKLIPYNFLRLKNCGKSLVFLPLDLVFESHGSCVQSSHVAAVGASDQDSGVEDEDLSPRPSPSPHFPTQQVSVMMVQLHTTQPNEMGMLLSWLEYNNKCKII